MRWPKYWSFSFSISSSNEYLKVKIKQNQTKPKWTSYGKENQRKTNEFLLDFPFETRKSEKKVLSGLMVLRTDFSKRNWRDFPGGPVAKTLSS